jgi:hypothetical protein
LATRHGRAEKYGAWRRIGPGGETRGGGAGVRFSHQHEDVWQRRPPLKPAVEVEVKRGQRGRGEKREGMGGNFTSSQHRVILSHYVVSKHKHHNPDYL